MAGLTAARSVLMVHSLQAMQQPEIHHHTCVALRRMPAASLAELRSQFVSSSSNLLLRHCVQASRKRGFFVAAAAADIGEEEFDGEEVAGLLEHPVDSVDEAGAFKEDSLREEQEENEGEDVEDLKQGFFSSLYGTQYGLRASSDTRAEVIELITQLEGLRPLRAQHINANLKVEEDVVEGVVIDRSDGLGSIVDVNAVAIRELFGHANQKLGRFVEENARELTIASIVFGLVCMPNSNALALPEGPLVEEFWDNVRRYGFYFFTVVTGGLYSLTKPIVELVKQPSTQILVVIALVGTFYLLYLTVSTMLGLTEFDYQYAQ